MGPVFGCSEATHNEPRNEDLGGGKTTGFATRRITHLCLPIMIIHMLLYIRPSKAHVLKLYFWLTIRQLRSPCPLDRGQEDCLSLLLQVPHH